MLVALLHHMETLKRHGLKELWMKAGVGDTTRFIPVHTLAAKLPALYKVLPAVHALSGCDIVRKLGPKAATLKADPVKYLVGFGQNPHDPDIGNIFDKAEEYLVHV